jgi:two-component system, response regulator / RNA-binding antiterminator
VGAPASDPALRILVSAETLESVEELAALARTLPASVVVQSAQREPVDVALVGLSAGESARGALALIEGIVRRGECPVVLVAPAGDAPFLAAGADLGIYASTGDHDVTRLRSAIAVAMARFAEHADARRLLERTMLIERATGIVMERYRLAAPAALAMLEDETRRAGLGLVGGAEVVIRGHRLLPARPAPSRRRRRHHEVGGAVAAIALGWWGVAQAWVGDMFSLPGS